MKASNINELSHETYVFSPVADDGRVVLCYPPEMTLDQVFRAVGKVTQWYKFRDQGLSFAFQYDWFCGYQRVIVNPIY